MFKQELKIVGDKEIKFNLISYLILCPADRTLPKYAYLEVEKKAINKIKKRVHPRKDKKKIKSKYTLIKEKWEGKTPHNKTIIVNIQEGKKYNLIFFVIKILG